MDKFLMALVVALLLASVMFAGYAIAIMGGFVVYVKMHAFFSILASVGCLVCIAGIADAMEGEA